MPHNTGLLATIWIGLVAALIGGFVATRLRLPPIIGYLLAKVAGGPLTLSFSASASIFARPARCAAQRWSRTEARCAMLHLTVEAELRHALQGKADGHSTRVMAGASRAFVSCGLACIIAAIEEDGG